MAGEAKDPAGSVSTRYEIANALGRLNANKPFLAKRCTQVVEYARAVRYMLNAIDLYHRNSGASYDRIAKEIRQGKIYVRFEGNRVVVVTP